MILERKEELWTYRVTPSKMYELVKNTGTMYKEPTGYFTDAESEMLTILAYLNYGEKTNITESMIAQVEDAIKKSESLSLHNE